MIRPCHVRQNNNNNKNTLSCLPGTIQEELYILIYADVMCSSSSSNSRSWSLLVLQSNNNNNKTAQWNERVEACQKWTYFDLLLQQQLNYIRNKKDEEKTPA